MNAQFTNFMLEDFINFVQKENLFKPDQKILIAVSGGIDSIILSKLFSLAKFNFGIAHVNFSLRGEESLADEVFVKKFAKTLKVPYHTICFDTNAFAEKEKLSTQVAARILFHVQVARVGGCVRDARLEPPVAVEPRAVCARGARCSQLREAAVQVRPEVVGLVVRVRETPVVRLGRDTAN